MTLLFKKHWTSIITIGSNTKMDYKQQIRLFSLNAFAFISSLLAITFVFLFYFMGSSGALVGLLVLPVFALVLYLNGKHHFNAARYLIIFLLMAIIFAISLTDRRTGTEFILIVIACSSILFFEKIAEIFFGFTLGLTCFAIYCWYDATHPFVADPTLPYPIVETTVKLISAFAVIVQLIVFRSLINSYSEKLEDANKEIKSTNEALRASNEEQHSLTEQLEWIVKQKSEELQSYLDAINVHIYSAVTDKNGIFLKVNEPLTNVTGFTQDELIGKNLKILSTGQSTDFYFEEIIETIADGKTWRGEVRNKRRDNTFFWIDMVIIPLKNEKSGTHYYLLLALPITERKEAEEQKEKTAKMLESVAFTASHKVRGPIARIQGLMNLMDNGHLQQDEIGAVTKFLRNSVDEMDVATRELTRFVNTHVENEMIAHAE
jgi:PAS domain S-box-containing protein